MSQIEYTDNTYAPIFCNSVQYVNYWIYVSKPLSANNIPAKILHISNFSPLHPDHTVIQCHILGHGYFMVMQM